MVGIDEAWEMIVAATSTPQLRVALALLSVGSFAVSLWSLRRTFSNTAVEQARYIESQWQAIYHLTLNNEKFARHVARMFAYGGDPEKAQKGAALLMYVNVLASTYNAFERGLISRKIYESHMKSFFFFYRGSFPALSEAIEVEGYDDNFTQECKSWIARGKAHQDKASQQRHAAKPEQANGDPLS